MEDIKIKSTFEQAEELFESAQNEMYKPEEDVVHYMVCSNSFKAVNHYLTSFLLNQGEEIHSMLSLEVLLEKCTTYSPRFKELDLKAMYSSAEDEDVWMNIETAKTFMETALQTRLLIKSI